MAKRRDSRPAEGITVLERGPGYDHPDEIIYSLGRTVRIGGEVRIETPVGVSVGADGPLIPFPEGDALFARLSADFAMTGRCSQSPFPSDLVARLWPNWSSPEAARADAEAEPIPKPITLRVASGVQVSIAWHRKLLSRGKTRSFWHAGIGKPFDWEFVGSRVGELLDLVEEFLREKEAVHPTDRIQWRRDGQIRGWTSPKQHELCFEWDGAD